MGRKVVEDHKIITENADTSQAEELIGAQTGQQEQYFLGDELAVSDQAELEKELDTIKTEEKELEPEASENLTPNTTDPKKVKEAEKQHVVVLVGAASYNGCGLRFIKNVPMTVKDPKVAMKLISTGLFIGN